MGARDQLTSFGYFLSSFLELKFYDSNVFRPNQVILVKHFILFTILRSKCQFSIWPSEAQSILAKLPSWIGNVKQIYITFGNQFNSVPFEIALYEYDQCDY